MGFFDKVKNMFTEEVEEDDVKVQKIKNDVTHVPIDSPVKEEKAINEEYNFSSGMSFSKPVFFDEDDFEDLDLVDREEEVKTKKEEPKKEEIKKEEYKREEIKSIYSGNTLIDSEEKKIFKPTPIISPVYGILDKNYHKEDIVNRSEISANEVKEDSIDSVRNKAYGTLEDELENTLFGNSILFKKDDDESDEDMEVEEIDEDSISSLTEDVGKELDKLIDKKKKSSRKVSKKEKSKEKDDDEDEDLLGFIDSTLYKDGDEE